MNCSDDGGGLVCLRLSEFARHNLFLHCLFALLLHGAQHGRLRERDA